MKSKGILLVDDDTDDQEFFIDALSELENVNLHGVANNGREALDMLTNSISLPDLIFMDFNMPLMNGIECLSEIVNIPRIRDIPVIMLSGAFEQAALSLKLGAKGFIKKSFDITELRANLHQIISPDLTVSYVITDQTFLRQTPEF